MGKVCENKKVDFWLPNQPIRVVVITFGKDLDFTKGVLESLFRKIGINDVNYKRSKSDLFDNVAIDIFADTKMIGCIGVFSKNKLIKLGITGNVIGFEIDFETLKSLEKLEAYKELLKYPSVKESYSGFVSVDTEVKNIHFAVKQGAGQYFSNIVTAEDTTIGGRRSVSLDVEYNDTMGTISTDKLKTIRNNVKEELKKIGFEIRDD